MRDKIAGALYGMVAPKDHGDACRVVGKKESKGLFWTD